MTNVKQGGTFEVRDYSASPFRELPTDTRFTNVEWIEKPPREQEPGAVANFGFGASQVNGLWLANKMVLRLDLALQRGDGVDLPIPGTNLLCR